MLLRRGVGWINKDKGSVLRAVEIQPPSWKYALQNVENEFTSGRENEMDAVKKI